MTYEKIISRIRGITCNSREVKPGYAFVAIRGFTDDGHRYIEEAVKRGASVIFTEKTVDLENVPVFQVKDSRTILGKLAAEYYNHPSQRLSVIGVTGTNGKTTTTHLIYNLLNYINRKCGLIGTVKIDNGQEIKPGKLTTPQPTFLQKVLREMVDNRLQYVAMEVSSHGIKLNRITSTKFALKIGTNITEDHFDLHSNFAEYKQVKKSFLTDKSNIPVLLNYDDLHLRNFGKIASNQIYFGLHPKADITAKRLKTSRLDTRFVYSLNKTITGPKKLKPVQFPLNISLPGEHNIYNTLVAVTIALFYGIKPGSIQNFFRSYQGIWRRLEIIYRDDFIIIDDCAHNPGSYRAVLTSVLNIPHHKLHIINAIRGNRGTTINRINARTIASLLANKDNYNFYSTCCNDLAKPDDKVTAEEEKAFLEVLQEHNINFINFSRLHPALDIVLREVKKDDIILLLGPHAMDEAGAIVLDKIKDF